MDRVPDKIIVKERGTNTFIVCILLEVNKGVPVYKQDQFGRYEHVNDAVRAVNETPKETKG